MLFPFPDLRCGPMRPSAGLDAAVRRFDGRWRRAVAPPPGTTPRRASAGANGGRARWSACRPARTSAGPRPRMRRRAPQGPRHRPAAARLIGVDEQHRGVVLRAPVCVPGQAVELVAVRLRDHDVERSHPRARSMPAASRRDTSGNSAGATARRNARKAQVIRAARAGGTRGGAAGGSAWRWAGSRFDGQLGLAWAAGRSAYAASDRRPRSVRGWSERLPFGRPRPTRPRRWLDGPALSS